MRYIRNNGYPGKDERRRKPSPSISDLTNGTLKASREEEKEPRDGRETERERE